MMWFNGEYINNSASVIGIRPIPTSFIVLDPSRVVLGCKPESIADKGYTVQQFVEMADGVAGINGGGVVDPNGTGDGSVPDTLIVTGGKGYNGGSGVGKGFVGIDSDYILHVGFKSTEDVREWDIQEGCGYGPILVINGEMVPEDNLKSGLNPRTAIGQRSDGAILMLVIEGRQPSRLGASYVDEAELMLRFGAVNACNLDGGSSTMMWFNGEYRRLLHHDVVQRRIHQQQRFRHRHPAHPHQLHRAEGREERQWLRTGTESPKSAKAVSVCFFSSMSGSC